MALNIINKLINHISIQSQEDFIEESLSKSQANALIERTRDDYGVPSATNPKNFNAESLYIALNMQNLQTHFRSFFPGGNSLFSYRTDTLEYIITDNNHYIIKIPINRKDDFDAILDKLTTTTDLLEAENNDTNISFTKKGDFTNFIKEKATERRLTITSYQLDKENSRINFTQHGWNFLLSKDDPFEVELIIYPNQLRDYESATLNLFYCKNKNIFTLKGGSTHILINSHKAKFCGENALKYDSYYGNAIDFLNDIESIVNKNALESTRIILNDIIEPYKNTNRKISSGFCREFHNDHFKNSSVALFKDIPEPVTELTAEYLPHGIICAPT